MLGEMGRQRRSELSSSLEASHLRQIGAARDGDALPLNEYKMLLQRTGPDVILTKPRPCLWIKVTERIFFLN